MGQSPIETILTVEGHFHGVSMGTEDAGRIPRATSFSSSITRIRPDVSGTTHGAFRFERPTAVQRVTTRSALPLCLTHRVSEPPVPRCPRTAWTLRVGHRTPLRSKVRAHIKDSQPKNSFSI